MVDLVLNKMIYTFKIYNSLINLIKPSQLLTKFIDNLINLIQLNQLLTNFVHA